MLAGIIYNRLGRGSITKSNIKQSDSKYTEEKTQHIMVSLLTLCKVSHGPATTTWHFHSPHHAKERTKREDKSRDEKGQGRGKKERKEKRTVYKKSLYEVRGWRAGCSTLTLAASKIRNRIQARKTYDVAVLWLIRNPRNKETGSCTR